MIKNIKYASFAEIYLFILERRPSVFIRMAIMVTFVTQSVIMHKGNRKGIIIASRELYSYF